MKDFFARFISILFVGLVLIKVSAFHVYEHFDSLDGSHEDCELCIFAIEGQQFESSLFPIAEIEQILSIIASRPKITYVVQEHVVLIKKGILLLRPPPYSFI